MAYNQKRHIQLLKKNQRKNLFLENREEDFELSMYNIAVQEHIFWQDRYQVGLLMEDFLTRKIDGEELWGRVYGLRRKLINACEEFNLELTSGSEKIQAFQPDERSKKLSGLLSSLYFECEHFVEDCENEKNEEFYASIKNMFLNFQEALNEE